MKRGPGSQGKTRRLVDFDVSYGVETRTYESLGQPTRASEEVQETQTKSHASLSLPFLHGPAVVVNWSFRALANKRFQVHDMIVLGGV